MSTYESGYDPKYGYNRNAFQHKTLSTAILGKVVKLIAMPIGLGSEAIHDYKDKKRAQSASATGEDVYVEVPDAEAEELIKSGNAEPADGQEPTHELVPEGEDPPSHEDLDEDEADWDLDEAVPDQEGQVDATTPQKQGEQDMLYEIHQIQAKMRHSKPTKAATTHAKLPYPVILPERRPGTKSRGFVRAYAPVLEDCDISQEMFLGFLKDFHTNAQANPMFDIVMVATGLAGLYPDLVVGLGIQALQVVVAIGQEIQERWRTNKFLEQANKEIFIPKGLYAMLVTYKKGDAEEASVSSTTVELGASAVAKYGENLSPSEDDGSTQKPGGWQEKKKRLRVASGATHESEMPITCATLVFPALDAATATAKAKGESSESTAAHVIGNAKSASKYVSNYLDRRAQAKYAAENPGSSLTKGVAPARFKSRFADPNNATSTHLFTLITGGKFKAEPLGAKRRWERAQRQAAEREAKGLKQKPKKRMLGENVLYLTVVNMPTAEQLEEAKKQLAAEREKKKEK